MVQRAEHSNASDGQLNERIKAVEDRLSKLDVQQKDRWDKFNILAALLIPAAIAFAGYMFSRENARAQDELTERNLAIGLSDSRAKRAQLVATFMEPLVSDLPQKRALAAKAILIALPEDGPSILEEVRRTDPDHNVQLAAEQSLSETRRRLSAGLFSDDASIRLASASDILQGWSNDLAIVPILIETARKNPSNTNGTYNTLVVLKGLRAYPLVQNRDLIKDFLETARASGPGPATERLIREVNNRLSSQDDPVLPSLLPAPEGRR